MRTQRFLLSIAVVAAATAIASSASAADVNVYVRPVVRPLLVPPPVVRVPAAQAFVVPPRCAIRTTRVWVAGRYVDRSVRVCR
jgi:hypothetical protein